MKHTNQPSHRSVRRRIRRHTDDHYVNGHHDVQPLAATHAPSSQAQFHRPNLITPNTALQLQSRYGNRYTTRAIQRQTAATEEGPQAPRATTPNLWSYDTFEAQMHQDQTWVGKWFESNVSGYDQELASIAALLGSYHQTASGDKPESERLRHLLQLVYQMRLKTIIWLGSNISSYRADEMTLFLQQLNNAIPMLQVSAQPYLGNQYVFGGDKNFSYVELRALDRHIQTLIAATQNPADQAALQKTLQETRLSLHTKVNELFAKFPPEILSGAFGMPQSTGDRIEFLEYMAVYLGSIDNVVQHFSNIRKAGVPGTVWLHNSAASRLEDVQNDVGGEKKMPASWVALGVRGRFRAHTRESNSRMAHPMGYAIDYRADENPMLTGLNFALANLDARMQTGNADERITMQLGGNKRRDLIARMGNGTASEAEIAAFEEKLASEYDRVSDLSENFGSALGPNATERLKELQPQLKANQTSAAVNAKKMAAIQKSIEKLQKNKSLTPDQQTELGNLQIEYEALQTEQTKLQQAHYLVWKEIQAIFAPYIQQIEMEQAGLGADINEKAKEKLGVAVAKLGQLESGMQVDIDKIIASEAANKDTAIITAYHTFFENYKSSYATVAEEVQTALSQEERTKAGKQNALATFKTQLETFKGLEEWFRTLQAPDNKTGDGAISGNMRSLMGDTKSGLLAWYQTVVNIRQAKEAGKMNGNWARGGQEDWRNLQRLKNALQWSSYFIFQGERNAKDPSVVRMLQTGYFNPDEAPADEKSRKSNKHGFDLPFIESMAKRGFDLGVAWSTSTDAMHFELVDGVDGLPSNTNAISEELNRVLKDLIQRGVIIEKRQKNEEIVEGEASQTLENRFGTKYKQKLATKGINLPEE